jgi:hypothetical protein
MVPIKPGPDLLMFGWIMNISENCHSNRVSIKYAQANGKFESFLCLGLYLVHISLRLDTAASFYPIAGCTRASITEREAFDYDVVTGLCFCRITAFVHIFEEFHMNFVLCQYCSIWILHFCILLI